MIREEFERDTVGSGNRPYMYEAGNNKRNTKDVSIAKATVGSGRETSNEIFEENKLRQEKEEWEELLDEFDQSNRSKPNEEDIMREGSFTKKQLEVNTEANISKMLNEKFTLTGSRAWGKETLDSDYDYVTTPDVYNKLVKKFQDKNVTYNDHHVYKALYVADMFGMYNIICVSAFDLRCWQFATKAMKGLVNEGAVPDAFFKDKDKVYGAFEQFRNMYRWIGKEEF